MSPRVTGLYFFLIYPFPALSYFSFPLYSVLLPSDESAAKDYFLFFRFFNLMAPFNQYF